jgi:hypothetical protein
MTQILQNALAAVKAKETEPADRFDGMTAFEVRDYMANEGQEEPRKPTMRFTVQLMDDTGQAFVCVSHKPLPGEHLLCECKDVADAQRVAKKYNEALSFISAEKLEANRLATVKETLKGASTTLGSLREHLAPNGKRSISADDAFEMIQQAFSALADAI